MFRLHCKKKRESNDNGRDSIILVFVFFEMKEDRLREKQKTCFSVMNTIERVFGILEFCI